MSIEFPTNEYPDVCEHKEQARFYVDIKLYILSRHYYQTLENPDPCGHKKQISIYMDIEIQIYG